MSKSVRTLAAEDWENPEAALRYGVRELGEWRQRREASLTQGIR